MILDNPSNNNRLKGSSQIEIKCDKTYVYVQDIQKRHSRLFLIRVLFCILYPNSIYGKVISQTPAGNITPAVNYWWILRRMNFYLQGGGMSCYGNGCKDDKKEPARYTPNKFFFLQKILNFVDSVISQTA